MIGRPEPSAAVRRALGRSAAQHLAIDQGELDALLASLPAPDDRPPVADVLARLPDASRESQVPEVGL
jgi:hypothetical protein